MPRNGKIARLPRKLREEVNLKLDNNIQSDEILAWLNGGRGRRGKVGQTPGKNPTASPTQSNQVKVQV
jgi:hypothetical protein